MGRTHEALKRPFAVAPGVDVLAVEVSREPSCLGYGRQILLVGRPYLTCEILSTLPCPRLLAGRAVQGPCVAPNPQGLFLYSRPEPMAAKMSCHLQTS